MAAIESPLARERTPIEAALVVALAVILLVALIRILTIPGAREEVPFTVVAAGVEDAKATLVGHPWGTELELIVVGLREDAVYVVRFRDTAGHLVSAGTFIGATGRPVTARLTAAVPRAQLTAISVIEHGADVVLGAELPSP